MAKIHIGVVSDNRDFETLIKESAQQMGGAYVHQSKSIYELLQKLTMQKVQLLLLVLPASSEKSEFSASYTFIRSKKDLQKVPVCVLTEEPRLELDFLLNDSSTRAYPVAGGLFLPLLTMAPMMQEEAPPEGKLSKEWIKNEFLQSLSANVGQGVQFQIREATDDERRLGFFSQTSEEVRTHLGWFKFTARMLDTEGGMSQLFAGMNRDTIEGISEVLLKKVTEDFQQKVKADLSTRGAIYFKENVRAPSTKYSGILYEAEQCQVLLEIGECL